jgi:alanyl aminopeptidase
VVRSDERVALRFRIRLPPGPVTLRLEFRGTQFTQEDSGIFHQQSGGDWYTFTQFEETDARRAFPCIDEPAAKIPWELTLRIPIELTAVSNTRGGEPDAGRRGDEGRRGSGRRGRWPSYLVAFGVGPFEIKEARPAGKKRVPVRIVAPRGRAHEAAWAARVTPEILEGLEDYFGIAYPYDKLDVLAIPFTVQFGAMENVGLVTFRSRWCLPPRRRTASRAAVYALVAAHEFAHQWFGDLVTAGLVGRHLAQRGVRHLDGDQGHRALGAGVGDGGTAGSSSGTRRRRRTRWWAPASSRQPGQQLQRREERLRRHHLPEGRGGAADVRAVGGPETFRRGIQQYLRRHADGNATARDFLASHLRGRRPRRRPGLRHLPRPPGHPAGAGQRALRRPRARSSSSRRTGGSRRGRPAIVRGSGRSGLHPLEHAGQGAGTGASCSTAPDGGQARGAPLSGLGAAQRRYAGYYHLQLDPAWRTRLVRSAKLDDAEKVGLLGDTEALVRGGAIPRARGCSSPPGTRGRGSTTSWRRRSSWPPCGRTSCPGDSVRPTPPGCDGCSAPTRGPSAPRQGPRRTNEVQLIRPKLTEFVARRGEDPHLIAEARTLAESWLSRPRAVAPEMSPRC